MMLSEVEPKRNLEVTVRKIQVAKVLGDVSQPEDSIRVIQIWDTEGKIHLISEDWIKIPLEIRNQTKRRTLLAISPDDILIITISSSPLQLLENGFPFLVEVNPKE